MTGKPVESELKSRLQSKLDSADKDIVENLVLKDTSL